MKIRQELNAMSIDFDPVQQGGQPGGAVDLAARLLCTDHRSLKLRHYAEQHRPAMPAPRTIYGSTAVIGRVPVKLAATTRGEAVLWCATHGIPFIQRSSPNCLCLSAWEVTGQPPVRRTRRRTTEENCMHEAEIRARLLDLIFEENFIEGLMLAMAEQSERFEDEMVDMLSTLSRS